MHIPWHRRLLYTFLLLIVAYAAVEGVTTWLWMHGTLEPESHWVYENNGTGWSYSFDPILGYALSSQPARIATVASNGVIETTGTIRGNNLGFPDDHDFTPQRDDPTRVRVAVFGDSFTAGYYAPRSWPEVAEERAPQIDFMNFAVDGGGLVNWWSVVTRHLAPQRYELDGVVFAVFGDDLRRRFSIYDDGYRVDGADVFYGRVPLAQISRLPETRTDAQGYLEPVDRFVRVTPERYEALLRGEWRPRSARPFRPFLLARALGIARGLAASPPEPPADPGFDPTRLRLMEEIGAAINDRGIPMLVVYLPWRDEFRDKDDPLGSVDEVREFATLIGADFLDGRAAFAGVQGGEFRGCWLPYDGHFSELGMQRFGDFVADNVETWLPKSPPVP